MVGDRTLIVAHAGSPKCRDARRRRQASEDSEKPAAGEGHVGEITNGWESGMVLYGWVQS
jgi:hypothetical protein